jgi:hypothetical protein
MNTTLQTQGSVSPITAGELDQVRLDSPQVSAQIAWFNEQLKASARSGAKPAWAKSWYGSESLRNEVARRFREAGFVVETSVSWGVADTSHGVRHHITIIQPSKR